MASGTFGNNDRKEDTFKRKKKLASRLLRRELGLGAYGRQKARNGLLKQVCISNLDLIRESVFIDDGVGHDSFLKG